MCTMNNNNSQPDTDAEMSFMENMSCDDGNDNDVGEIESILIGKPLFIINLDPQPNQEVVECMADKNFGQEDNCTQLF